MSDNIKHKTASSEWIKANSGNGKLFRWWLRHWLLSYSVLFALMNLLPFVAPVFMHIGWTGPARVIYTIYSPFCHQMAQRSFFLFGEQLTYNIADLPVTLTGDTGQGMTALRSFVGNPELGWKVAWSDRMVYMYGALLLATIAYGLLHHRRPMRPLGLFVVALLMTPLAVDGLSHLFSDINGGLLEGFRYSNLWLAELTGHALPAWFYRGDALGSFNSWMRLISGLGFGLACVGFGFPYLERFIFVTVSELPAPSPQGQKLASLQALDKGTTS